jgi:hypothetical protein
MSVRSFVPGRAFRLYARHQHTPRPKIHRRTAAHPIPTLQDTRARALAHAADPQGKEDVAVQRHVEVGREREEMGVEARECAGEAGAWKE